MILMHSTGPIGNYAPNGTSNVNLKEVEDLFRMLGYKRNQQPSTMSKELITRDGAKTTGELVNLIHKNLTPLSFVVWLTSSRTSKIAQDPDFRNRHRLKHERLHFTDVTLGCKETTWCQLCYFVQCFPGFIALVMLVRTRTLPRRTHTSMVQCTRYVTRCNSNHTFVNRDLCNGVLAVLQRCDHE